MFEIPEAVGADLVAFGLLALALILLGALRAVRPLEGGYRTGFRLGLWLVLWHGLALVLRMTGFA